jgi:hypothetical protein
MRVAWWLSLISSLALVSQSDKIATTEDLVRAMQQRYAASWYRTVTFVQKTTTYAPDGTTTVATWYEAMSLPGRLRIDFAPSDEGNGILFAGGQSHSFKSGKLDSTRPVVHPLLLLGFDIYFLPTADVMEKLATLNFDLSILREDSWQGRPVYVVGAKAGDAHSAQFWIDREHLYFVRLIRPAGRDGAQTQDTRFNKYRRLGGGWMAPEVVFLVDGKPRTTEEYSELHADVTLDPRLFDPQYWTTVHWK